MPAKPLTEEQLADARRLKSLFQEWQKRRKLQNLPWSQDWASDQLGIGQSGTAQYLNGKIPLNLPIAGRFATLLNVDLAAFSHTLDQEFQEIFGSEPFDSSPASSKDDARFDWVNSLDGDNFRTMRKGPRVPQISWVQAGAWAEIQDNFHAGQADQWVEALHTKPSARAFALVVDGDSMTSPYPVIPNFPEGTRLICDPEAGYSPGSYVIAKDVNSQTATFKQLKTDGGHWFLKPLNPAYKTIEIDDPAIRVIATVIEFQPPGGKLR